MGMSAKTAAWIHHHHHGSFKYQNLPLRINVPRKLALNDAGRFIRIKPSDNLVKYNFDGPPLWSPQCTFPDHEDTPTQILQMKPRAVVMLEGLRVASHGVS
jgi:hypothetical protein